VSPHRSLSRFGLNLAQGRAVWRRLLPAAPHPSWLCRTVAHAVAHGNVGSPQEALSGRIVSANVVRRAL
jgi:hypothetical protein